MIKEAEYPKCKSIFFETLAIEEIEKDDWQNELTLVENVVCSDCQYQFSVKARYKLELLESELA
ncbi:hypothetical protein [Turicibacter sanguinis]|uniref:hypothetical protein n=1 Tax=Turicibacter sanguinis TaxID=154288 RepID=UPI0018AA74BC|nr:hypothetical protein [Turicibacter sanguinis]MDB8554115.1 hypothetical protein [Turicibacter sanguinis]